MQIGGEDPARHRPLGAVARAVPHTRHHPSEGPRCRAQVGHGAVVLVAGEQGHAVEGGLDQQLAHRPPAPSPHGAAVEEPEARMGRPVGVGELVAQHLDAGAHAEDGGAAVHRRVQGTTLPELLGRQGLRAVLAAAHQVQIARRGHHLAGADLDHIGADPAPVEALGEHDGVAAVAVGPQQLGVQHRDRDLLSHGTARGGRPGTRCSWRPGRCRLRPPPARRRDSRARSGARPRRSAGAPPGPGPGHRWR